MPIDVQELEIFFFVYRKIKRQKTKPGAELTRISITRPSPSYYYESKSAVIISLCSNATSCLKHPIHLPEPGDTRLKQHIMLGFYYCKLVQATPTPTAPTCPPSQVQYTHNLQPLYCCPWCSLSNYYFFLMWDRLANIFRSWTVNIFITKQRHETPPPVQSLWQTHTYCPLKWNSIILSLFDGQCFNDPVPWWGAKLSAYL